MTVQASQPCASKTANQPPTAAEVPFPDATLRLGKYTLTTLSFLFFHGIPLLDHPPLGMGIIILLVTTHFQSVVGG